MILQHPAAEISRSLAPVGGMMFHLSQYLMSAGYIGIVVLFAESRLGRSALALLAPFGRMALTNYIMQSVILSFIFYRLSLHLLGRHVRDRPQDLANAAGNRRSPGPGSVFEVVDGAFPFRAS